VKLFHIRIHYFAQTKTSRELIIHTGPQECHSSLFVWHTVHVTGSDNGDVLPFCK